MPVTEFILSEDAALKAYLGGMVTTDGHPVRVWFRLPEQEQRDVTYPFVTIDLIDIVEALDRNHRGRLRISDMSYVPEGMSPDVAGSFQVIDYPLPFDLFYQVSVYSRSARHDRSLQSQIWHKFPGRFGVLEVNDSLRTMQLVGSTGADRIDEYGKRLFQKVYTVTVVSELVPEVAAAIKQVLTVNVNVIRTP